MPPLIIDLLLEVLHPLCLVFIHSFTVLGVPIFSFNLGHFLGASLFNSVNRLSQLSFLLVVCQFFICACYISLEPLLSHFLVIDEFLGQVLPFETCEVPHAPSVIVEGILPLFATNKLVIKSQGGKFRLFLGVEFDPALDELDALTATSGLLTRVCNGCVLFLEVDSSDIEPFR